ncbi:MAG: hypothetical protein EOO20_00865 [Chryseobacterium sp.]|nr:MAG: hypothetical protein EOO20_00865 [Chryseobacterium sp.]
MEINSRLLQDIVDLVPFPLAVFEGEQLKINIVNQAMIQLCGINTSVTGKNFQDIFPKVGQENLYSQALHVLRTGIPYHEQRKGPGLPLKDISSNTYLNYSFVPLYGSDGEICGVMNTVENMTDLHDAQQKFQNELKRQVDDQTKELRRSNEDLLQFASTVSHDLREPLRKIRIFEALLRDQKETVFNEKVKKYLDKIESSTARMEQIIEGILAYSTMNKTVQRNERIDLNQVMEEVKMDLELIIEEKGAVVTLSKFPVIEGAPILITQLFYNLVQNALKFSRTDLPPEIIIHCESSVLDEKPAIAIMVRDNGIGFDPAFADRVFNAFERLHSKDSYDGNGLGLSLCRKIVQRHGGRITVNSEIGQGAEFIVTLPLVQSAKTI